MNRGYQSQQAVGYESPSSEIWMLESRNLICTSGNLEDLVDQDDYNDGWN